MGETAELEKAKLIPFDGGEDEPEGTPVVLDFNPETLQFEVTNALGDDKREPVRQAATKATAMLSFEAVFDHTRPGDNVPQAGEPEELDVRRRTEALLKMLAARKGEHGEKPNPKRVRFAWGAIVFDGALERYSETLEYFSAKGIPLRSRLSITLTEDQFQYEDLLGLSDDRGGQGPERARRRSGDDSPSRSADDDQGLYDAGSSEGDSTDSGDGETTQAVRERLSELPDPFGMGAEVAQAATDALGVDVDPGAAMKALGDVGGQSGATAGAGTAAEGEAPPIPAGGGGSAPNASSRTTSWAPDGPRPGSQAWQVAAAMMKTWRSEERTPMPAGEEGGKDGLFARAKPVSIVGSPPLVLARPVRPRRAVLVDESDRGESSRRDIEVAPSWEAQPDELRRRRRRRTARSQRTTHSKGCDCHDCD